MRVFVTRTYSDGVLDTRGYKLRCFVENLVCAAAAPLLLTVATIVTTLHPLQVLDEELPETEHDFRVDLVVTSEETLRSPDPRRPPGILWSHLSPERIAAIPVLASRAVSGG